MTLVKNIKNSHWRKCRCGSRVNHWDNYCSNLYPEKCVAIGCKNKAEVGGHVTKVNGLNGNHYIIPICYSHNKYTEPYLVTKGFFAPANISSTCGQEVKDKF